MKNFKKSKLMLFIVLILIMILIAIFAPYISTHDPLEANMLDSLSAPNSEHIWGTDKLGRDVFSRVIYGTRTTLFASLLLITISFITGTVLGMSASYFGGLVDICIMRLSDMMMSFPGIVLAIAIAGIMGTSLKNAVFALCLVSWPKYARMVRSLSNQNMNSDYVTSAKLAGVRPYKLMSKYIFPNIFPSILTTACNDIGTMIIELASLSFLGFGAKAPTPEWGLMLNEARMYIGTSPWLMIYPGLAILITVIIFNMFGDSVREVMGIEN